MLESQLLEGWFAMISTKTSDEGIKRDVEKHGSTIKTIKNESTSSSSHDGVWYTYYKKPCYTKETCWNSIGNPKE